VQVTYGEGQHRGGAQLREQVAGDAVGGEHVSGDVGEISAIVTRVEGNGHADFLVGELLFQIVGQSLGSGAHRVFVHAIGTYAHDAAQTTCAEFQVTVEGLGQLVGIVLLIFPDFCFGIGIVVVVQPQRHAFFNIFIHSISD